MRTSEFIAALAADPVPEPIRLGRRVAVALVVGLAASVAIYVLMLGPRPDIAAACDTMRFWLKFVDSFAFALPTVLLTLRLARPDAKPRALALWLLAPFILLAAGVVVELLVVPRSEWMSRLMGATALHCTITIPMLAAPILVALIVALRPGAPLYPGLTGAMAGAAAAGVGALVYASSCPGNSPLFVATWYPLATLICMGVGALAGRRFLAWFAEMMRAPAEARRASAHEPCVRQLQDASFRALVLGLAAWIEEGRKNGNQIGDKALKRDIKDVAEKLLDRLDAKATKRGRAVGPDAEAAELHPLRKSLKKLRYSVEFLQSLYRPKATKQFLRRLKKLQDALGEINDAAMATRLAEALAADKHLELAPSVAALSLNRERAARGAMKALAKSWQAYCDEPRFWKRA